MSETTTEPIANGHAAPSQETQVQQSEQELNFRLKSAIDSKGRYAFRMADMAAGYAAGRGTDAMSAKSEIEQSFTQAFGYSPQEYLDRHYEQLRENSEKRGRPKGRSGR